MKTFYSFLKVLVLVSAGLTSTAQAALIYDFSYEFDGFTSIDGTLEGTPTGGVVTVSDVMGTISSTGGTLGVSTFSFDTSLGGFHISGDSDGDSGTFSLDGSFFDLAVVFLPESNNCLNGNGFCLIGTFASVLTPSGSESYTLNAANFTVSEQVVSEPSTLAIIGLSLAVIGFARRKKA
ncbi:PEP-CTERM sorting domain-containing protein [Aliiglaciecola sp. 2_MG-2023]|uniref:PEP-CTERM sorting domain-containing protein n=1 Tax=unclassified Aliiglaciecola TaxID=2593648 RepID=UPI0026E20342|nr:MULTISPECIES: PEP-CTERM sorting domain-containing protein [unclassified Aliiglaciecola]MDO6710629.1 PEP-CTERM sorting domain-containing protein [Aliiglaciecola sp. 2_MG-2023]MDO6754284.1 PEP-CTERM sorting domain-containing protein [Aliiglaciecola sp. 1_MG-2023]